MCFPGSLGRILLLSGLSLSSFAQPEVFIHNFHHVDEHVLRGGQPGTDGVRALAAGGVKTIVDLRPGEEREAKEKTEAEALGMKYISVPLSGFRAPSEINVERVLATLNDASAWPVFVHCKSGVDRTGTIIACYRMKHDGWDSGKALAEAEQIGMHRWESGMKKFILSFPSK